MKKILLALSALFMLFVIGCGGGGSTDSIDSETPQTIAINKIMQYADDNTQPIPDLEDYADAGVVGVTLDNIDDVNSIVTGLTASDVDTTEKIQKIVDDLGINILPTANAGPDKNVEVNQAVTITGSGSDIDGTIVSYEWTKNTTVLATTPSFEYIPTSVGTDTLKFSVMDDDGGTASDSMNVIVSNTATPLTFENDTVVSIIDDGIGGAATPSEINVDGATTSIAKVTVTLDITHSWISDLVIRLMSPSGNSIILSNVNIPYAINYVNTTFDDDAIRSIEDEDGNITGTYRPVEPLGSFNGEDSNGIWTLEVHDEVLTDSGTLNSWSITLE